MPPTPSRGEGENVSFSVDPVGVGVHVGIGVPLLEPRYLLNQLVEFHQTCMDILLEQALELSRFWWPWPHFQGHRKT